MRHNTRKCLALAQQANAALIGAHDRVQPSRGRRLRNVVNCASRALYGVRVCASVQHRDLSVRIMAQEEAAGTHGSDSRGASASEWV